MKLDRRTISAINPLEYSKRFLRFMAENIFQDSTADYSSKPLPRLPSPKFRSREILYDSQSFLLIENSTEEEADNFDSDSKTIVK